MTRRSTATRAADGRRPDLPEALPSADLLILVVGTVLNWIFSSPDLLAADGRAPTDLARVADFRDRLALAVKRLEEAPC